MKTIGVIALIGGICLGIFALSLDTSVEVNYPLGNSYGLPERVNNLGLMNDRQNYVTVAGDFQYLG